MEKNVQYEENKAKKQNVKPKKNRKKNKRKVFWLKFITLLLLFSGITVFLGVSSIFNIDAVEVLESEHYKRDSITRLSGINTGENGFLQLVKDSPLNLLMLRYKKAETDIKTNCPYIKNVYVMYKLPARFRISILERIPAYYVPVSDSNLIIDSEGYLLDAQEKLEINRLLQLRGIDAGQYVLGARLQENEVYKLSKLSELLEGIKSSDEADGFDLYKMIGYVDIGNPRKIMLSLEGRIQVGLGELQDLNYRLTFLKQLLAKNIKKDDRGFIDFDNGRNPSFIPEKPGK